MPPKHIKQQGYGDFLCKSCNVRFASHDKLMEHKAQKRVNGSDKHIHCKFCGLDFATEVAEIQHIQQYHPHEQKLECPGCGHGPFTRVSQLMAHIESGQCTRINVDSIEAVREKKQDFPKKLEALTNEPVKGNYSKFMSSQATSGIGDLRERTKEAEPPKFEENDFPELPAKAPAKAPLNAATSAAAEVETNRPTVSDEAAPLAWTTKENLFPNAPSAKRPTDDQLRAATQPSAREMHDFLDPDHPDHPNFNAARYCCEYSEKFVCPRMPCGKSFKKATGLIAHLRSPAHADTMYTCPYCFKRFKTLTAVTAHCESSSLRCDIRNTQGYDAYMDQLTAGIIDVNLERHDDGTIDYKTSESSRQVFGAGKGPGEVKPEIKKIKKEPVMDDSVW